MIFFLSFYAILGKLYAGMLAGGGSVDGQGVGALLCLAGRASMLSGGSVRCCLAGAVVLAVPCWVDV